MIKYSPGNLIFKYFILMFCMSMQTFHIFTIWVHFWDCIYTRHQEAELKERLAVKYKNAETLYKRFQADSLDVETLVIIWNLNFQEHHQMLTVSLRFG